MARDDAGKIEETLEEAQRTGRGHALAIGFYVAAIILIFGTILVLHGLLGPADYTQKGLGINVNLWWGLFMIAFGCVVLGMSWASPRRRAGQDG